MTASLATPILPTETAVVALGGVSKKEINQIDGGFGDSFGKLFGEALSGVVAVDPINSGTPGQVEELVRQLQSLPQDGKLLPLMTEVLDGVAAAGGDAEQVLAQVNANLEQLLTNTGSADAEATNIDLNSLQTIAGALQQVVEANTHYLSQAGSSELPSKRLAGDAWQQQLTRGFGARPGAIAIEQATTDVNSRMLDTLPAPSATLAAAPGQAQAELAAALHAIRRLANGQQTSLDILKTETLANTGVAGAPTSTVAAQPVVGHVPTLTIGVPLQQAGWDQALGERIQWLVSQASGSTQAAQIKLNPAHLGPMEVRIHVQNDQATVQFTATHAVVREALEAALPRLREMFDASGVELVNVDVSGESFAHQQRTGDDPQAGHGTGTGASVDAADRHETVIETPLTALPQTGRLDLFA